MKNLIVILMAFNLNYGLSQTFQFELGVTHDLFSKSYGQHYGGLLAARFQLKSTTHFEYYAGIEYQDLQIDESQNRFTTGITGFTKEKGGYLSGSINYFPFKQKHWMLGLTLFSGVTHQYINGSATFEQNHLNASYNHRYTYFNYGLNQMLGYRFNRFQLGGFAWVSFKGMLDEGAFRPGDFDSRLLLGISAAYTLITTKP